MSAGRPRSGESLRSVQPAGFVQGMTDHQDGDAKSAEVQKKVLASRGLSWENLMTGRQVHGDHLVVVRTEGQKVFPGTDGLLTDLPGVVLGVFAADCAPLLLADPVKKVVGAVHSGWRGTYKQIARAAVERMVLEWGSDPADLVATVGPHIRDCCYTVGPEVSDLFPEDCRKTASGGTAFSIEKALLRQLTRAGVRAENISGDEPCTFCSTRFFSYRRDKTEKRMLAFIAKI